MSKNKGEDIYHWSSHRESLQLKRKLKHFSTVEMDSKKEKEPSKGKPDKPEGVNVLTFFFAGLFLVILTIVVVSFTKQYLENRK